MNLEQILEALNALNHEEKVNLKLALDSQLLAERNSGQLILELEYNRYKGSGKCWIAIVDETTKKILNFLKPESVQRDGYKGTKVFEVEDGYYLVCQAGSKSYDDKKYIRVFGGEIIEETK